MHVTLLVPDLFWPRDDGDAPYRDLELPGLSLLLARARRRRFPALAPEAWLCQAFEVEQQQDWPVAPLTLEFDGGAAGDAYWLRADPVHFLAHRDRLTLLDATALAPTPEEAADLTESLSRHFARDGLAFQARHAARWYVAAPGAPRLVTRELTQAAGRDVVGEALPGGEDGPRWRGLLNEIQMVLHEHPVNQRREAAGALPINSVWLWGGGRRPAVPGEHFTHVATGNALAEALGARAGAEPLSGTRLPADRAARVLVAAEPLGARHGDDEAWRASLRDIDRAWCAPLLAGLRRRAVDEVAVVALHPRGCTRYETAPRDLLRFWRVPRPLSAHAPAPGS